MTVDDLVYVLEDLLEHMAVSDLRQGIDYKPGRELSDKSWGLLVRFIGGERPTAAPVAVTPPEAPAGGKTWEFDDEGNPVDTGIRHRTPQPQRHVEVRDPDEEVELRGEFNGVKLL